MTAANILRDGVNIVNDGVEALTRECQARFQGFQVLYDAEPRMRQPRVRLSSLGLNSTIDSFKATLLF